MGYWRDEAVNDMENMDREQTFGVSHNVRMRCPLQKWAASWKKISTFFIAYNSVVELIAVVYVGSKVQTGARRIKTA